MSRSKGKKLAQNDTFEEDSKTNFEVLSLTSKPNKSITYLYIDYNNMVLDKKSRQFKIERSRESNKQTDLDSFFNANITGNMFHKSTKYSKGTHGNLLLYMINIIYRH